MTTNSSKPGLPELARAGILGLFMTAGIATGADAGTFTYDFTGSFAQSWSTSNANGRSPVAGGTFTGFFTLNTDNAADWKLLDYTISTVQPLIHVADRQTEYDYDTRGVQEVQGLPVIGKAQGLPEYTAAGGVLTIWNYDEGPFSGYSWASSYQRLTLSFDPNALGDAALAMTASETYGRCASGFNVYGPFNTCTAITGQQNTGSATAALRTSLPPTSEVPLPATGLLALFGLAGMAGLRRRHSV